MPDKRQWSWRVKRRRRLERSCARKVPDTQRGEGRIRDRSDAVRQRRAKSSNHCYERKLTLSNWRHLCHSSAMDDAVNSTPGDTGPGRTTALLVVNRNSGTSDVTLDQLVDRFRQADVEVSAFFPEKPEEMEDLIRGRGADMDFIVLGGGDGTLNRAVPALLAAKRPVGILPMGTANDLARTLGIPADLEEAVSVILDRHIRPIDLGMVNGRPFFNVASVGFSVAIARFHKGERKRLLGLLSYPLSWLDAYRTHRSFRATIACDDTVTTCRCVQLVWATDGITAAG